MEKTDLDLINKHKETNKHLWKLWEDHLEYEKQIEELENSSINSVNNRQLNNLKRLKLKGRDEIETILKGLRK